MELTPPAARNVELKCRCRDLAVATESLRTIGPIDAGIMRQVDTYFPVPHGRLKLREIVGVRSELIWYSRADAATSRNSDYRLTPVSHPAEMRGSLNAALGTRGTVSKVRHLLLWQNVRIHLDDVAGLGTFVEFEAVMSAGETEPQGHSRVGELCRVLGFTSADHERASYSDLLGL